MIRLLGMMRKRCANGTPKQKPNVNKARHFKNKAPQTLAVRGNADNPLVNGLSFVANVMQIIDQLAISRFRKLQFKPEFRDQYAHARVIIANYVQGNVRLRKLKFKPEFSEQYAHACARDYIKISPCENPSKLMVKTLAQSGIAAYNAISLKPWQHPTTVSLFFYVPISAACLLTRGLQSMGTVLVNGNVPAAHGGESSVPTFFGVASNSQNHGGHHA